jgi:hypothetical protein
MNKQSTGIISSESELQVGIEITPAQDGDVLVSFKKNHRKSRANQWTED